MTNTRILTSYYRPKPGGCCKRLFQAINALLDAGHEVHYLSVIPFPINHPNCNYHRYFWPKNNTDNYLFWAIFHLIAPFQMLYLGYRYNITHCFSFNPSYALLLQLLCRIKRIPLSFFIRGDTIESHKLNKKSVWLIKLESWLEGISISKTRVYGNSRYLTDKVINRHTFFKPLISGVIPNNINYLPETRVKKTHSNINLACVGTLDSNKNQQFLLTIMNTLSPVKFKLYIYGDGQDNLYLKNLARQLNITDQVIFKGWVNNNIWDNIDILLSASLNEGSPNAILESLENGVPVIASNIPQHIEILPENTLLSLDNIDDWTNALNKIITDQEYLTSIYNEQSKYSRNLIFDWNKRIVSLITAP